MVQAHMDEFCHPSIELTINVICKILNDYFMCITGSSLYSSLYFSPCYLNSLTYPQVQFHSSES